VPHALIALHSRSVFHVAGTCSYSLAQLHSLIALHSRSVVPDWCLDSYAPPAHVARAVHPAPLCFVASLDRNCVVEHVVMAVHARSDVFVALVLMYSSPVQALFFLHTRFVAMVGAETSCSSEAQLATGWHGEPPEPSGENVEPALQSQNAPDQPAAHVHV